MKWQTLCIVAWSATLVACSEGSLRPSRDLGAQVTYRIAGGLAPRETTTNIARTGRVDLEIKDYPNGIILSAHSALTSQEFEQLSRLLNSFEEFDACYCTNEGLLDGPSELVRVAAESTTDVQVYGVSGDDLPADLNELLSLLRAVASRVRDQEVMSFE